MQDNNLIAYFVTAVGILLVICVLTAPSCTAISTCLTSPTADKEMCGRVIRNQFP